METTSGRVAFEQSPLRCPFCHDGIETESEPWVACATCLARHHTECWDDGGVCAACGREQRLELATAAARATSAAAPAESPDLVHVARDRPGALASIAEALRRVAAGGKIVVGPGTYRESLVLDRTVTLAGSGGRGAVVIEAAESDCVRVTADRAAIEGLTLRIGARNLGESAAAALRVARGAVRVSDCDLESATLAPALVIEGAEARPRIVGCRVRGEGVGALVARGAHGTLERCEIAGARQFGLGVRGDADPEVSECSLRGGAFGITVEDGARGTFRECEVDRASEAGVRVTLHANPSFARCRVRETRGSGVLVVDQGEGTFDECSLMRSGGPGVLVERGGDPLVRASKVLGGTGAGVVVRAGGRGRIEGCRIAENGGAGVELSSGGRLLVAGCRIRGNTGPGVWARAQGGGVVERCELAGNGRGPWLVEDGARVERRENSA